MENMKITMANIAPKTPGVTDTSVVTMEDIAPKGAPVSASSAGDTMQALVRDLPQQEPQVNYLWELYSAQERRKQNPQPEAKRTEGFDPLSVLAGVQR